MNDIAKFGISFIAMLLLLFVSMASVLAVDVDSDDTFYVSPGDVVDAGFVVSDFSGDLVFEVDEDFYWLVLDDEPQLLKIDDSSFLVPYQVLIPKSADIGVYRTSIAVIEGSEVRILNVKLSVQNSLVSAVFSFLSKIGVWYYIVLFAVIFFFVGLSIYKND